MTLRDLIEEYPFALDYDITIEDETMIPYVLKLDDVIADTDDREIIILV
jgi:hypothetical protein